MMESSTTFLIQLLVGGLYCFCERERKKETDDIDPRLRSEKLEGKQKKKKNLIVVDCFC